MRTKFEIRRGLVVMAFDENGQASTYADKIRICERAYRILVMTLVSAEHYF